MKIAIIILFTICLVLFGAMVAQAQTNQGTLLPLTERMELVYGVDFYGKTYDFIVNVTQIKEDGGITFKYRMGKNAYPATVSINGTSLKVATGQSNRFNGRDFSLPFRTTVWISEKVFDALTGAKASVVISPDEGKPEITLKTTGTHSDYALEDGSIKNISYIQAETEDKKISYRIHHNRNNRLILQMDIGWKIWLKSVKYPD